MKRINILDLHKIVNDRKDKHIMCYEKVLELSHNKIKKAASQKSLRCLFEVPNYVFGYPLFNLNECIDFVISELKKNGFVVNYYFPNKIYISWDFEEINESKRIEKPKTNNNKPGLVKYKTSGKLELNLI